MSNADWPGDMVWRTKLNIGSLWWVYSTMNWPNGKDTDVSAQQMRHVAKRLPSDFLAGTSLAFSLFESDDLFNGI